MNNPSEITIWDNLMDAIEAIETELGADPSGVSATVAARFAALTQANVAPAVTTLTDGATVTLDASLGRTFRVTLAGNRTLALSNATDGQVIDIEVTQDGTGSRTLTLPSGTTGVNYSTTAPSSLYVLSTTAAKTDVLTLKFRTGLGWMFVGLMTGF